MNDYAVIADIYDSYVNDARDAAFWSRWAERAAGPILELTAGSGRATVPLASAARHPVVALDLAPAMLSRLVVRLRGARLRVAAVAADMTRLPLPSERFGLVVVPFNSFGELVEPAEREAALREIGRVLLPRGRAILTLHDPGRRCQTLDGEVREMGPFPAGDNRLQLFVRGRLVGPALAESRQVYRILNGAGDLLEERQLTLRFALPDAGSLLTAAAGAGLRAQAVFGDYDESAYEPGRSPFIIAVLGRAAEALGGGIIGAEG